MKTNIFPIIYYLHVIINFKSVSNNFLHVFKSLFFIQTNIERGKFISSKDKINTTLFSFEIVFVSIWNLEIICGNPAANLTAIRKKYYYGPSVNVNNSQVDSNGTVINQTVVNLTIFSSGGFTYSSYYTIVCDYGLVFSDASPFVILTCTSKGTWSLSPDCIRMWILFLCFCYYLNNILLLLFRSFLN